MLVNRACGEHVREERASCYNRLRGGPTRIRTWNQQIMSLLL